MDRAEDLFDEPLDLEHMPIDIPEPKTQKAQEILPKDFQIKTMDDVSRLKEFLALNYTNAIRLYRGHESKEYKVESTIFRLFKDKNPTTEDIAKSEREAFEMFRKKKFKHEWLSHKLKDVSSDLFIMSIGRHLGLPCRLLDVTAQLENAIWFTVMNPNHFNEDGEVVLIFLDKENVKNSMESPFETKGVSYANEPFLTDDLDELPLGEQRRFVQDGRFIWVDNNSLLSEQCEIEKFAYKILRFDIPSTAKENLASDLYRDIYSGVHTDLK